MLNINNLKYLQITYADPNNLIDEIVLNYRLRNTTIAHKWIERVYTAQKLGYTIDDPKRFYGFGTTEQQISVALNEMNALLDKLENFWRIPIGRRLLSVDDQDTLNYLHHIFEVRHGLLGEKKLNPQFQQHLSDLNILVHRCESIQRGAFSRHVVTYFGLPKDKILDINDYQYFDPNIRSGTIYLNYVEIGKTLQDLMLDNDQYIFSDAFRPFNHYSADFYVPFYNIDGNKLKSDIEKYYIIHKETFESLGFTWDELSKSIGSIPVADLESQDDVLNLLESRQFVKAVQFS
jgi:hypothetical protein